jgi:ankyrin repeat protein
MMRELFLRDLSLWTCLWQSSVFAGLGLIAGWLLRRRPARAYQVLLLAMTTAVVVPLLSAVVKHLDLGAFVAKPTELSYVLPDMPVAMPDTTPDTGAMPPGPPQSMSAGVVERAPFRIPWRMVLRYGWLAATLALLGRLVATFLYGVHLVRHASRVPREDVRQAVDSAVSKLAISWGLQVRASRRTHSPLVWCWSRPAILLVPDPCEDSQVDWGGVVAHELAHCRRWDHMTGLVAEVAASLMPWNPLMWVSRRILIRLGEQACDDWVVASGQSSEDYAESLLHFRPQKQMAFWPAVVSSQGGLAHRIRRILNDACGNPRAGVKWALTLGIAALTIGLGVAFAQTRPASSQAQPEDRGQTTQSLHQAAKTGDVEVVKKLIARGVDLNGKDKDGWTPLHHAAWNGRRDVAAVLIAKGANVNATDARNRTPLHLAATFGERFVPELLLAKGANINARDEAGDTPLHVAAGFWCVNENLLELLIEKGADVNARNGTGQTPLHLAVTSAGRRKSESVVEFLLAHGADINARDKDGRTPLHVAAGNGTRKETVEFLLNKGADIKAKNAAGATALHLAATNRHPEFVELLVNHGADVNSVDSRGQTPLHYAVERGGDNETVERLIAKGADVNAKAANGETPAHLAAIRRNPRDKTVTLTLLLSKGADISSIQLAAYLGDLARVKGFLEDGVGVNTQDVYSVTPLHAAALGGQKEVAEFLLSKGALVNADSAVPSVTTPLHCAALAGSREVAELLIRKGAEIDAKDTAGMTPLYAATNGRNTDTARLLIAQGADVNAKHEGGWTPLHLAAHYGVKDLVLLLLDHGADMNAQSANGMMPSEFAAQQGHEDVVRLLIDKGADLSNRDVLLLCACKNQQKDLAELLIRKGADVNSKAWQDAPALQAIWYGYGDHRVTETPDIPKLIGILKLLLDNGADPDTKDRWDWSLLHYACGNVDLTKFLLDRGANPNVRTEGWGLTPLHLVAGKGNKAVTQLLLSRGADVNAKDFYGHTPLSYAEDVGDNDILGRPRETPLTAEIKAAKKEVAEVLRKHGAKE